MRASARYHERQTNEAEFRSLREVRKCRTFSRTFSRTWSGKGDGFSVEPGYGSDEPVRFLFDVDDSAISPLCRSGVVVVVCGLFSLIVFFFSFRFGRCLFFFFVDLG